MQLDGFSAAAISVTRIDPAPAYVDLDAELSNFDADPEPDGWLADVVLRSRDGHPVAATARARFEILLGRSPSDSKPIQWSVPLEFDEAGVSRAVLPLRQSMYRELGWSTQSPRATTIPVVHRGLNRRWPTARDLNWTFVTVPVRDRIGYRSADWLRLRVAVPGHGTFYAVSPVRLRPSFLVDTSRTYR